MTVKHYEDIDYSAMVPEDIYLKFVEEARRMAVYGDNGKATLKHEIARAYFRYSNFGRKPESALEVIVRTQVFEEMFQ